MIAFWNFNQKPWKKVML